MWKASLFNCKKWSNINTVLQAPRPQIISEECECKRIEINLLAISMYHATGRNCLPVDGILNSATSENLLKVWFMILYMQLLLESMISKNVFWPMFIFLEQAIPAYCIHREIPHAHLLFSMHACQIFLHYDFKEFVWHNVGSIVCTKFACFCRREREC